MFEQSSSTLQYKRICWQVDLRDWKKQHLNPFRRLVSTWFIVHPLPAYCRDFDSLDEHNVEKNNQLAFDIAEKEFGISPIMTGKEMASVGEPDKLSMVMYLTQFYEMFKDTIPSSGKEFGAGLWSLKSAAEWTCAIFMLFPPKLMTSYYLYVTKSYLLTAVDIVFAVNHISNIRSKKRS